MRSIWDILKNLFLGALPEAKQSSSLDKPDTSDNFDYFDYFDDLDDLDSFDDLDNFDASGSSTNFKTYLYNERCKTKRRTIDQVCNQMAKEPYWQSLNEKQQSIVEGELRRSVYLPFGADYDDYGMYGYHSIGEKFRLKDQQLEELLSESGVSEEYIKPIVDVIHVTKLQVARDDENTVYRASDSWLKMLIDKHLLEPVNDDNINILVDWWCWALTEGGVTEAKLYKRLHLHLDAAGSLATKIVNGKPEPCVITDTYVANRDLELPPLCGAASVTVYAKPNVKISQYGHSHNRILCCRQMPEDLPFLRGDVAEGVRAKNKEAGDIIDLAVKIEGIFDQLWNMRHQDAFEGATSCSGVNFEGAVFMEATKSDETQSYNYTVTDLREQLRKIVGDGPSASEIMADFDEYAFMM